MSCSAVETDRSTTGKLPQTIAALLGKYILGKGVNCLTNLPYYTDACILPERLKKRSMFFHIL
jgi:hypothetical protein